MLVRNKTSSSAAALSTGCRYTPEKKPTRESGISRSSVTTRGDVNSLVLHLSGRYRNQSLIVIAEDN